MDAQARCAARQDSIRAGRLPHHGISVLARLLAGHVLQAVHGQGAAATHAAPLPLPPRQDALLSPGLLLLR